MLKTALQHISPKDKPWNQHKAENREVGAIYAASDPHRKKAERMHTCSGVLLFGEIADDQNGEISYRLLKAHFCRVRYCPICQWRRSLLWRAKFYQALPSILDANPTARFVFLTLTVKNCRVENLRETLQDMNKAWRRFTQKKEFSSIKGWVRTTEVTRGENGLAHPHFHCLLMVPSWYFSGSGYVKKDEWAQAWQSCLRVDYTPVVDVRTVKPKKKEKSKEDIEQSKELPKSAIVETLKYSVKPSDMTDDPEWFITMSEQTHRMRFIATGGLFKDVLKPEEKITNEEMVTLGDNRPQMELVRLVMRFLWEDKAGEYLLEQAILPGVEIPGLRNSGLPPPTPD